MRKTTTPLKGLIVLAFCLITNFLSAQDFVWAKSMGATGALESAAKSVATDAQGNVYSTGTFQGTVDFNPAAGILELTSIGSEDVYITKFDSAGNFIWAKSFGSTSTMGDFATGIAIDKKDGSVCITGNFAETVDFDPSASVFSLSSRAGIEYDAFILKLDTQGNFVWAKKISGQYGQDSNAIAVDGLGNIYLTGDFTMTTNFNTSTTIETNLTSVGNRDSFVLKLDSNGDFVWVRQFAGVSSSQSFSKAITVDVSGNIYTTGRFNQVLDFNPNKPSYTLTATNNSDDIFVAKLNSDGVLVWAKQLGGAGTEQGNAIAVDVAGNVYTTGYYNGNPDFDPGVGTATLPTFGGQDIFVSKLNSSGDYVWAKNMGGTLADSANGIFVDTANNVYTTGSFNSTVDFNPATGTGTTIYTLTASNVDAFVSKLDSNGNFVWAKNMGGTGSITKGNAITVFENNVYTAGEFDRTTDFDPSNAVFNLNPVGVQSSIFVQKLTANNLSTTSFDTISFSVSPNPVKDIVTIQTTENLSVIVYDLLGKKVASKEINTTSNIVDLGNQKTGVYLFSISNQNGEKKTVKVIKK